MNLDQKSPPHYPFKAPLTISARNCPGGDISTFNLSYNPGISITVKQTEQNLV